MGSIPFHFGSITVHFGSILAHFDSISAHSGSIPAHFGSIAAHFGNMPFYFGQQSVLFCAACHSILGIFLRNDGLSQVSPIPGVSRAHTLHSAMASAPWHEAMFDHPPDPQRRTTSNQAVASACSMKSSGLGPRDMDTLVTSHHPKTIQSDVFIQKLAH